MPIVVSTDDQSGELADYTALLAAIALWSNRTDLTAVLPTCVRLFEARCNRQLRVSAMEAPLTSTALADGAVALPTGFLAFKELRYDGSPSYTLEPRPLEWVRNQSAAADRPGYFAITDTQVVCWPTSGSIVGTYYEEIPSLAVNSTNWLLVDHPDAYLFGALEEVGLFIRDKSLVEYAGSRVSALLEQIKGADIGNQLNGGPLTVRAR